MAQRRALAGAFALYLFTLSAPVFAESEKDATEAAAAERTSAEDEHRPNLVRQIGIDFKNVFTTKENLWIVGAGAGASLLTHPFDSGIPESRFNSELFEGGLLDETFEPGATVGGALFQGGAAAATFALGKVFDQPELASVGRDLIRAQIVTQGLTQALKLSVGRTRPDGSSRTSFPSGHTSATFASATVLERHYGWKVGIPAYAVAGWVAASRLSENKHYLSDVIFGAALGIVGGRTVTFGVRGKDFALSPMIVPGGAGVQISLVR